MRVRKADAAFRKWRKRTVASHFPTANAFGATHYTRPSSANADKDGWPANMLLN
jgi:hypothetical protein